jgi:hypothetical protein
MEVLTLTINTHLRTSPAVRTSFTRQRQECPPHRWSSKHDVLLTASVHLIGARVRPITDKTLTNSALAEGTGRGSVPDASGLIGIGG